MTDQKDMLEVKHINRTSYPFPRCHVLLADLKLNTNVILRPLVDRRSFLNSYKRMTTTEHEMKIKGLTTAANPRTN